MATKNIQKSSSNFDLTTYLEGGVSPHESNFPHQKTEEENSQPTEPCKLSEPTEKSSGKEQSSAKRVSQKQRKSSLEEYKNCFLSPPKITDRKTVYLSKETRDQLDEIVRRLGERGSSVSGFIENMANEHLNV